MYMFIYHIYKEKLQMPIYTHYARNINHYSNPPVFPK